MDKDKMRDQDLNNSLQSNKMICSTLVEMEIQVIRHNHLILMHIQMINKSHQQQRLAIRISLTLVEVVQHPIKQNHSSL